MDRVKSRAGNRRAGIHLLMADEPIRALATSSNGHQEG
jgi:hypothetical protein